MKTKILKIGFSFIALGSIYLLLLNYTYKNVLSLQHQISQYSALQFQNVTKNLLITYLSNNSESRDRSNIVSTTSSKTLTTAIHKQNTYDKNRNNPSKNQKLSLHTLQPINIKTQKLEGFTIYTLYFNTLLNRNQTYLIDTRKFDYDEFLVKIQSQPALFKIIATTKPNLVMADVPHLNTYISTSVTRSYTYISNIVYKSAPYLIIQPESSRKLLSLQLWKYNAPKATATNSVTNSSIAKASTLNTNTLAQGASVSSYYTNYTKNMSSGLKVSSLDIIPRSQWGENPNTWDPYKPNLSINDVRRLKYIPEGRCRWMPEYYQPHRFVIHHTVTKNYPSDPYREIREIYIYHAYSRGWGDIGYNFIIDSQGRIFEGKIGGAGVKGYHAFEAANEMSIGIALIGNFTDHNPTTAQLSSLSNLLAEQSVLFNIPLKYCSNSSLSAWLDQTCTVFGHRHVYVWDWDKDDWKTHPTACPGEYFVTHGKLAQAVTNAKTLANSGFTTLKDTRTWGINLANTVQQSNGKYFIKITFKDANSKTLQQLSKYIPQYSGIWSIKLMADKKAYITMKSYDNGYCGLVIPPTGWQGYDSCGPHGCMYFPPSKGVYDRLITILTALKLNPYIEDIQIVQNPNWARIVANTNSTNEYSIGPRNNTITNHLHFPNLGD